MTNPRLSFSVLVVLWWCGGVKELGGEERKREREEEREEREEREKREIIVQILH